MKIIKCDRCGTIYDLPPASMISGFRWTSDAGDKSKAFDLCPGCMEELADWMENKPAELEPEPEPEPAKPKRIRLTMENREAIIRDMLRGGKRSEIAKKYELEPNQVGGVVNNFRRDHPERYEELTAEVRQEQYGGEQPAQPKQPENPT